MADKKFDIAVFGATGFTGRLVAQYLAKQYPAGSGVSWAMVGRSNEKLEAVRDEIGAPADTPLVVADASDPASIKALVESAKVVLTTVGPYQLYGNDLVAACAAAGTDYVDLCGEPAWMRQMIDKYGAAAKASGARIVFSCGFDSIPSDLGVFLLQAESQKKFSAPCTTVKGLVRSMKGTFSGGTAASFKATVAAAMKDPSVMGYLKNPFSLAPGFEGPKQPSGSKVIHDDAVGSWLAPFVMAAINTKNVHRSNALLGHAYGEGFVYCEMVMTGPGEKGEAAARAIAASNTMMSDDGPKPGEGPSKEEREAGAFDILFLGTTQKGETVKVAVTGDMDPGYGSTSKMISEAAICLITDCQETPGGVWTTAPAMGHALIERLRNNAGLTFEIED